MKTFMIVALLLAACNGKPPGDDIPRSVVSAQEKVTDDFEKDNPKWSFAAGKWVRREGVLAQTAETQPWAVAILEDKRFSDVDVTVKFRPISGKEDASGGLIVRAKDAKNYYLVRANGLEDNFRLYTMKDGSRNQLASTKVDAPKLREWHTMRVVAKGAKIQAYFNGKLLIDHDDKTYSEGYVGLWTKADSVTEFEDLEAIGSAR
ncbi:MAG TPA: family 16 glycoside hydrolase [Planctomycetota bacterium]|nr:family 16 glycoside hydrolase [Planctomycetota bacterium]